MKKIVLAYSGGLDTSIILRWLQENYKAEIIAYTSDIGQEMDEKKIIRNAKRLGVKKIIKEYPSKKINIGRLKTPKKNAINTVKIKSENKIIIELKIYYLFIWGRLVLTARLID